MSAANAKALATRMGLRGKTQSRDLNERPALADVTNTVLPEEDEDEATRTPVAKEARASDFTPPKESRADAGEDATAMNGMMKAKFWEVQQQLAACEAASPEGSSECTAPIGMFGDPSTRPDPFLDAEAQLRDLQNQQGPAQEPAPKRLLFFAMLCVFQGYAVMVGPCQQKFKSALHVSQTGASAEVFTQAADFVHWGKFFMRVGHNLVFGCLSPRSRVLLAMSLLFVGCSIPPLFVFTLGYDWLGSVFLSYGLSGMGIGISECTFLSVVTPLGGATKSWVIMAVPVGFAVINIGGMIFTSIGVPVESLYWYVVAWIPVGMFIFHTYAPKEREVQVSTHRQSDLKQSFGVWRSWLPMMAPCLVAKVLVNFAMENITPVSFYTFNGAYVPMFDPAGTTHLMNHDLFFALLGLVTLAGNAVSQHVAYKLNLRSYAAFVALMVSCCLCAVVCCWLVTFKIASVNLGAVFLAFWVNGTVYGASTIFIDRFVPKEHNLLAYSLWCMIGDLGPILGGAMMDVLRNFICGGHAYTYTCRTHNLSSLLMQM